MAAAVELSSNVLPLVRTEDCDGSYKAWGSSSGKSKPSQETSDEPSGAANIYSFSNTTTVVAESFITGEKHPLNASNGNQMLVLSDGDHKELVLLVPSVYYHNQNGFYRLHCRIFHRKPLTEDAMDNPIP
ncbi:hypothetical protein MUK42_35133 [Musa troglodytarum]|uniref:Uncharacterized protein n=1 Tax=Musa troglodytarum TaxID=320322 RepID=A0A9E7EGE6_9LILI|nr:hypothetical protein MUK42_35133 [Musa troglodytarum]